jgi:hypothetical protein
MVAVVIAAQVDFVIPAQAGIQSWRIVGSCGLTSRRQFWSHVFAG